MRLLLDECMPRRFARLLSEHSVETVQSMRWRGVANGALLNRIRAHGFDVFITVDRGLPLEQNITNLPFAIVILRARSNDADVLLELLPKLRAALENIQHGAVSVVQ